MRISHGLAILIFCVYMAAWLLWDIFAWVFEFFLRLADRYRFKVEG